MTMAQGQRLPQDCSESVVTGGLFQEEMLCQARRMKKIQEYSKQKVQ